MRQVCFRSRYFSSQQIASVLFYYQLLEPWIWIGSLYLYIICIIDYSNSNSNGRYRQIYTGILLVIIRYQILVQYIQYIPVLYIIVIVHYYNIIRARSDFFCSTGTKCVRVTSKNPQKSEAKKVRTRTLALLVPVESGIQWNVEHFFYQNRIFCNLGIWVRSSVRYHIYLLLSFQLLAQ